MIGEWKKERWERRFKNLMRVKNSKRKRILEKDMIERLWRGNGMIEMKLIGGGDIKRVYLRVGKKRIEDSKRKGDEVIVWIGFKERGIGDVEGKEIEKSRENGEDKKLIWNGDWEYKEKIWN